MTMKWYTESDRIQRGYSTKIRRENIPSPKMPTRHPYSVPLVSPTGSTASSSSWSSSQESLNIYGSSPKTSRMCGFKPQDRLRRIREEFNKQQSRKMEVDREMNWNPPAQSMKRPAEPSPTPRRYLPMTIDENTSSVEETSSNIRSVSLRLRRFRQARSESMQIDHEHNINHEYTSPLPWNSTVPSSNKRSIFDNSCGNNVEKLLNSGYKVPQWMLPVLSLQPLRRPHFSH